jgi:uncharacterized membrane protein YdjX (TVP38/TMEM64 family)
MMKKPAIQRIAVIATLVLAGVLAWRYIPRDSAQWERITDEVRGLGAWGPVLLAAVYVPASVLLIPGSWLSLAGGFAFGMLKALAAVSAGSTVGACAAFLVSRFLLRGWIERRLANSPRLRALDRAVEREGFKIVLLTRLSPILPFGVLNYAFGATKISFGRYALASWIGMLPGTLLYCSLGSAARRLADLAAGEATAGPWRQGLFFVGLAATAAVTYIVTRLAARALRDELGNSGD